MSSEFLSEFTTEHTEDTENALNLFLSVHSVCSVVSLLSNHGAVVGCLRRSTSAFRARTSASSAPMRSCAAGAGGADN